MRSWIELYDVHMTDIAGCTIKAACDALRIGAQVFCERTKVWRADLDPMITQRGVQVYDFDLSSEVEIVKILAAKLDGCDIPLQTTAAPGDRCICVMSPLQFALYPTQAKGLRIQFYAALEPSATASGMEEWVADKYGRLLAKGAKAELLNQTAKPYSDPNRAMLLRAEFDQGMAEVMAEVSNNFSAAPVRVAPQFF
jgi:hypothetical protein